MNLVNCAIYSQQQIRLWNGLGWNQAVSIVTEKTVGKSSKTGLRSLRVGVLKEKLFSAVRRGQQGRKSELITHCDMLEFIPPGDREEFSVGGCHVGIQTPISDEGEIVRAQRSFTFSAILHNRGSYLKAMMLSLWRKLNCPLLTGRMSENLLIWFAFGSRVPWRCSSQNFDGSQPRIVFKFPLNGELIWRRKNPFHTHLTHSD